MTDGKIHTTLWDVVILVARAVPDSDAVAVRHDADSNVVVVHARRCGVDTREEAAAVVVIGIVHRHLTGALAAVTPIIG